MPVAAYNLLSIEKTNPTEKNFNNNKKKSLKVITNYKQHWAVEQRNNYKSALNIRLSAELLKAVCVQSSAKSSGGAASPGAAAQLCHLRSMWLTPSDSVQRSAAQLPCFTEGWHGRSSQTHSIYDFQALPYCDSKNSRNCLLFPVSSWISSCELGENSNKPI